MAETLTLWTRQEPKVVSLLRGGQVCRVRSAYIDVKYGDAGASFERAYAFFSREMALRVPPQAGEESPYWLHGTAAATGLFSDSPLLRLRVPRAECVLFDARRWNHVLNLSYLGDGAEETRRFEEKIAAQGLRHASDAFRMPYYPLLRREIEQSWTRLFLAAPPAAEYLQAAAWRLDPAWLLAAEEERPDII